MTANEMIAVLQGAKDKLERGWCRGVFALNNDGMSVAWSSKQACRWCLRGAVLATAPILREVFRIDSALHKTLIATGQVCEETEEDDAVEVLAGFNDECKSVTQVIELIDNTIARLLQETTK